MPSASTPENWDLWRSVFADEVIIDTSDYEPEPPPRRLPVDAYVSFMSRLFSGFEATQHLIGTHRFSVDGDHATITAHFRAEHWASVGKAATGTRCSAPTSTSASGPPDGWRISSVKLHLLRQEGNREVMRRAESAARRRDPPPH